MKQISVMGILIHSILQFYMSALSKRGNSLSHCRDRRFAAGG